MPDLKTLLTPNVTRNPARLTAAHALHAAIFPIPVITIFWQEQIGMSLAGIMILQSIFAATIVVLEFHSLPEQTALATVLTWLLFARA